ncbi:hypothetical protein ES705_07959 [subsurface metagenome]
MKSPLLFLDQINRRFFDTRFTGEVVVAFKDLLKIIECALFWGKYLKDKNIQNYCKGIRIMFYYPNFPSSNLRFLQYQQIVL